MDILTLSFFFNPSAINLATSKSFSPIVGATIEKIVNVPVAVIIPEKDAFMKALEIIAKKINE